MLILRDSRQGCPVCYLTFLIGIAYIIVLKWYETLFFFVAFCCVSQNFFYRITDIRKKMDFQSWNFKCISGELCLFFPVNLLYVTGPFHFRMWRVYCRWGSSSGGWSPLQEAWARGWGQREVKTVLTWHIPEEFPWVSKSSRLEEEDWSDSGLGDGLTAPSWWPVVSGKPCVFWGNYGPAEDTTKLTSHQLLWRSTQIPLTWTKDW